MKQTSVNHEILIITPVGLKNNTNNILTSFINQFQDLHSLIFYLASVSTDVFLYPLSLQQDSLHQLTLLYPEILFLLLSTLYFPGTRLEW